MRKFNLLLFFFLCICGSLSVSAQLSSMQKGDSLFQEKKYTEAFKLYEESYNTDEISQAMILKMAFIKEGLGNYVAALFYLNQYYKITADKAVLVKMEELANNHNLTGYSVGDADFFQTALLKFKIEIQLLLAGLALLLTTLIFSSKKTHLPIGLPIVQVFVLVGLMIISNDWLEDDRAIIQESTLLMSGPSAAAEPIESVAKGHKVEIIEESDVWIKIRKEDEIVYIRKSKLMRL